MELPIHGHNWHFRSGAAELAHDTNAILLPVFSTLVHSGHMIVTFEERLTSTDSISQRSIEDITRQYAMVLEARWPALLSSMNWGKLQQMLDYAEKSKNPGNNEQFAAPTEATGQGK